MAGVNNSDVVVGTASTGAAIYTLGSGLVDLNTLISPSLGWHLNSATAINDAGQIVGTGVYNGVQQAFLLTPVPEPSTLILGIACVAGLGFVTLLKKICRA